MYVTLSELEIGAEEGETPPSLLIEIQSNCARTSPMLNAKVNVPKRINANIIQQKILLIRLSPMH
jgi:hypothetical protein